MSDIEDKTYIYLLGQYDDNCELMYSESFKIGKANDLKQRFKQEYKNNTGYINPRYIRVIEISKRIHNVPDKPIHAFLLLSDPIIKRKSKHRELFAFDGSKALDLFDEKLCDLPSIIKYYKDPIEIQELVERESIIKDVVNNLVNDVISENREVVSDNSNKDVISLEIYDDVKEIIKSLVKHCAYNKWDVTGKTKPAQYDKYFNDKYISIITKYIPDIDLFLRLSENFNENKDELIKIMDTTYDNLKIAEEKKIIDSIPKCIVNIIKSNL